VYGRIMSGLRVLELAVNGREAALGKGARCLPTSLMRSS
jgi:hypothetical protein